MTTAVMQDTRRSARQSEREIRGVRRLSGVRCRVLSKKARFLDVQQQVRGEEDARVALGQAAKAATSGGFSRRLREGLCTTEGRLAAPWPECHQLS